MLYRDLIIVGAGLLAGAMNAAGGGGSFLAVPVLIWIGIPSLTANMSSAVALYMGSVTSVVAYRGFPRNVADTSLPTLFLPTLAGGFTGAMLLMHTAPRVFDAILPWLLLVGSFVFAVGPRIGGTVIRTRPHKTLLLFAQFLLGAYGGYFGGAVGILMMAVWSLFGAHDVKLMNPAKVLLVAAANTMAVICFVVGGTIAWHPTVTMLIAASLGGYLGARVTLILNSSQLRVAISVVNFVVTTVFFVTYMHR